MIRRPPRSTLSSSSAASDVYKRQVTALLYVFPEGRNVWCIGQDGSCTHNSDGAISGRFHGMSLPSKRIQFPTYRMPPGAQESDIEDVGSCFLRCNEDEYLTHKAEPNLGGQ